MRMRNRFHTIKKLNELRILLREFRIGQIYLKEDPDSIMDILDQIDKLDDKGFFLKVPAIQANVGLGSCVYDYNSQQFMDYDLYENEDIRGVS